MASPPTVPIFRSRLAFLGDSRCPGAACDSTSEELAEGHSITFVRRGVFVRQIGRKCMVADPTRVVFFARERPFRVSHVPGLADDCSVFAVRMDTLLDVMGRVDPAAAQHPGRPHDLDEAPCPAPLFRRHVEVMQQVRRGRLSDLAAEEAVLGVVAWAIESIRPSPQRPDRASTATRRSHAEAVEAAQRFLATRFREPIGLDDVAAAACTSPYHLCRIFRRQTGTSIARYRNQLRLRAALEPLAESSTDLTRLALELGYGDQSHFTNAFRGVFGVTPGAFRRSARARTLREMSRNLQVRATPRA